MRICFVGQGRWACEARDLVRQHSEGDVATAISIPISSASDRARELLQADVVVRVGFRPGGGTWRARAFDALFEMFRKLRPACVPVCYWIGSDVMRFDMQMRASSVTPAAWRRILAHRHLAGAPWLAAELHGLGIEAETALFPTRGLQGAGPLPLPAEFRVLTYVPDRRASLYGGAGILKAAETFPDVPFLVMGGRGGWAGHVPSNVRFVGWTETPERWYREVSVVVRYVQHDALGATVRQALSLGRHVIYTYPVEGCIRVPFGAEDLLVCEIATLRHLHQSGQLGVNEAGAEFARTAFDERNLTMGMVGSLRRFVEHQCAIGPGKV